MPDPTDGDAASDGTWPLTTMRAVVWHRLMAAEDLIAQACYRRGMPHETVLAALDAVDDLPDDACSEDLYLSSLALFVGHLGGRLEVRAVFDDESVLVSQR